MLHFSVCAHIWLFIITYYPLNWTKSHSRLFLTNEAHLQTAEMQRVVPSQHMFMISCCSSHLCIQFIRCLHYYFLHCPLRVHILPAEQICFCLDLISRSVKPSRAAPSSNCRQVELHLPFKWRTGSATLEMAVEPDTKKRGGWVGGGWDSNTQISCKRIVSVGWVRKKKTCAPGQQCVIAKGRSKQSTAQRQ